MNRSISDWGANILALALLLVVNGLANSLPLGGRTTGEVSASYPSLIVPAGYVFSIWGLIYLTLIAFVIWQALPAQRSNEKLAGISLLFIANCAANAVWLFTWHYDLIPLSLLLMLGVLGTLVQIYRKLGIGAGPVSPAERWFAHLPFSIYTGWITVATIANFSAVQTGQGWDDLVFNAVTWTLLKIAVAGAIAATVLFRRHDVAYVLVIVWASIGINVKQVATPAVAGAAAALAALAGLLIVIELLTRPRSA